MDKAQLHASLAQAVGRPAQLSKPWRMSLELYARLKLGEEIESTCAPDEQSLSAVTICSASAALHRSSHIKTPGTRAHDPKRALLCAVSVSTSVERKELTNRYELLQHLSCLIPLQFLTWE